jgi:hypothetical protein
MIFEGAAVVAHEFLDEAKVRDLRATYGLHLRGGRSFTFTFEDGKLAVTDGIRGRVDCRVSADPRSLVLVLYRRSNQWAQIGRGGLFAYGRKPWLALRFADLFKSV